MVLSRRCGIHALCARASERAHRAGRPRGSSRTDGLVGCNRGRPSLVFGILPSADRRPWRSTVRLVPSGRVHLSRRLPPSLSPSRGLLWWPPGGLSGGEAPVALFYVRVPDNALIAHLSGYAPAHSRLRPLLADDIVPKMAQRG